MNTPLKKFVGLLKQNDLSAYLVTHDHNIRYLTGFRASESWLLVTVKGSFYITDFRYIEEAKQGLPSGVAVRRYAKSFSETLFEILASLGIQRFGFDDRYLSLAAYNRLKKSCPASIKPVIRDNLIESLREIKTPQEIQLIRKALQIHGEAYKYIQKALKPGVTERAILAKLENFVRERKVGFSFSPIIASGSNSAFPHARVSDRKFGKNDIILVDIGIDVNDYKSDLTRMFFLGKIPNLFKKTEAIVRTAQQKAIKKIRAGVAASAVDYEARNYLAKNKLAKYFGHSLGHGVGVEIHENPRLSENSTAILKENMVVTVEPAVYLPHRFGIRIEDMVLVTQNGCEVLSANID